MTLQAVAGCASEHPEALAIRGLFFLVALLAADVAVRAGERERRTVVVKSSRGPRLLNMAEGTVSWLLICVTELTAVRFLFSVASGTLEGMIGKQRGSITRRAMALVARECTSHVLMRTLRLPESGGVIEGEQLAPLWRLMTAVTG